MKDINAREVKDFVLNLGADLVGIAGVSRFESTQNRRAPSNVLPEAQSVVVFVKKMLRGSLESPRSEVVTHQNLALYEELNRIGYQLGVFLEQKGFMASMVPPYSPVEMTKESKGMVGVVSLRHVAIEAGLGTMGKNNLLLTPQMGPRVRIGAVVTDAPFVADKPLDEDLCSDCHSCIDACPVDALSEPGKTHTGKCLRQALPYGLSKLIKRLEEIFKGTRKDAKEFLYNPEFWNIYQSLQLGLQYGCHQCINSCSVGKNT